RTEIVYDGYPQWQARALLQAGKCLENERQWRDASRLYARVLKEYGTTSSAEDASKRLRVAYRQAKRHKLAQNE
ncbi:MAG: tol-pal system YbgF family protein, partial [Pirellulales bacterium]